MDRIKESYYGPVDMEVLVDSILRGVLDCLDKDSKIVKGEPSSLDFVRGLEGENSISEARLITPGGSLVHLGQMPLPAPSIGYIKIGFFGRRTGAHFQEAVETLGVVSDTGYNPPESPFTKGGESGIKGLLLDLRDNPGGHLQSAVEVLKHFIPSGKTLLVEKTRGGEKTYLSEGGPVLQLPMVILINASTASSAEIVAATLRYHCGCKVVGEKSKGKGTIQEVIPLGARTLILTTGEYLLPDGSCLKDKGVMPDLEVKGYEEQLQAALSLLKPFPPSKN